MNAIVLVIDRLNAGYLGAYGNTWIDTPAFDRLATESFLFDQAMVTTVELERLHHAYWQGWPAMGSPPPADRSTLPGMLRDAGVKTILLTDDRPLREHPLAVDFDEVIAIDPPYHSQPVPDGSFEQSHLVQCFLQITDCLRTARRPFLLWCHLASLGTIWDAPLEFRRFYREEDDPDPPQSADVPDVMLAEDHDPDEKLGYAQAYAGQMTLLDTCLGGLCEAIAEHPAAKRTLLAITSSRGFPLGEHRRVGPCDEALYSELVQVPLLLRFPDALGASARSQSLVEPGDLWATLLDCWRIAGVPAAPSALSLMPLVRDESPLLRDRLMMIGPNEQRAIRTPAWHLRSAQPPELFAKPDDRWEVNNVATRCLEVVECLQDATVQYEQAIARGSAADLPPLSDALMRGLE